MKIYVNQLGEVLALRNTKDISLKKHEIDTDSTKSFFYGKCDTFLLGMIYDYVDSPQADGSIAKGLIQSYSKDLKMLETIQQLYEENQLAQLKMAVEVDARLTALELGL